MILSISKNELIDYYYYQLNNFFPDKKLNKNDLKTDFDVAMDRLNYCFKHLTLPKYFDGSNTIYNHLHSDQALSFIWYLSNEVFKSSQNIGLSSKLYYLNKALHGFDCMYDTKLPDIFLVFHGVGTVLGKATYNDFFIALHGCTVGANKGIYPTFGKGVTLAANSSVIGNSNIGDRVNISTRTMVYNASIESGHCIYINTSSGKTEIKRSNKAFAQQFFNVDLKAFNSTI